MVAPGFKPAHGDDAGLKPGATEVSRKFVEIQMGVPRLLGLQEVVPRYLPPAIGGLAAEHGGERRLRARRGLVVKLAALDAGDERLLLLGIGFRQVVVEGPR